MKKIIMIHIIIFSMIYGFKGEACQDIKPVPTPTPTASPTPDPDLLKYIL